MAMKSNNVDWEAKHFLKDLLHFDRSQQIRLICLEEDIDIAI